MTRGHIRQVTLAEKAEIVRQMLALMAALPLDRLGAFLADPRNPAAGESYLRRALEALLDLGRHLLAKGFGIPAVEYKEIPRYLLEQGVLDPELGEVFGQMAGYRNRLVHMYDEVTPKELHGILTQDRGDIGRVLDTLLTWVEEHPERVDKSL